MIESTWQGVFIFFHRSKTIS